MIEFLVQSVLAEGNNDSGNWFQMLVPMAIMAFWIIGGILKVKSSKRNGSSPDDEKPEPAQKPAPRILQQFLESMQQPVRPKPSLRKQPTVRKEIEPEIIPAKKTSFELKSELEDVSNLAKKPEISQIPIVTSLELEGSVDLKRAILHYEILGKPVGLRKPGFEY